MRLNAIKKVETCSKDKNYRVLKREIMRFRSEKLSLAIVSSTLILKIRFIHNTR